MLKGKCGITGVTERESQVRILSTRNCVRCNSADRFVTVPDHRPVPLALAHPLERRGLADD